MSIETVSRYGRFLEDGRCFETRGEPPRRWANLHTGRFGADPEVVDEVSHQGDGPLRLRAADGRECRVVDHEGTYLYVRDDADRTTFCPGGGPAPTPVTGHTARFHPERTELCATCAELRATERIFVPLDLPLEIRTLMVENLSDRPRTLSVFAYAAFAFSPARCARPEPETGGVFAWSHNPKDPDPLQRAFLGFVNGSDQATAHREAFLRAEASPATPRILWEDDLVERGGFEFQAIGAIRKRLRLSPGGTARVDVLLGHAQDPAAAAALRRGLTPARIDALCAKQTAFHHERESTYRVGFGHPNLEALANHFLKKQVYGYLIAKSGFRDNLQVAQALVLSDPHTALTVVERALASQHAEGWPPACFRPLRNSRRADMPAWILTVVPELVKETGDFDWLHRPVPFLDGSPGTVWDHLLRAMRCLAEDSGPHGLCRLHEGDWNDGLSPRGETGERESVMVTQQFCAGLRETAGLARRLHETSVAGEAEDLYRVFAERINRVAWDGEWYQRVLCGDGTRVGSAGSEEGRIFMNAQSWAVLSGIAPPDRAIRCMDAVEAHLALDIGYRVCAPPFSRFDPRVGLASNTLPGHIENGGCYNHAAGFKAVADCVLKRPEQAWRTFRKVAPDNPDNPVARSRMEPFALVNMFFAHDFAYGEAFYPWRTGTGAWITLLLVEWILGARRDYNGLRIDPCLPGEIPKARVRRRFRGAVYDIHIDNTSGRGHTPKEIRLDGAPLDGTFLPDLREGEHRVDVVL